MTILVTVHVTIRVTVRVTGGRGRCEQRGEGGQEARGDEEVCLLLLQPDKKKKTTGYEPSDVATQHTV